MKRNPHYHIGSIVALVGLLAFALALPAVGQSRVARPEIREVTVPAGTPLNVRLENAIGSDISRVEEPVRAVVTRAVVIRGFTAIPANSVLLGNVVEARRPGRVKGRGAVGVRFTTLKPAGSNVQYRIRTRRFVAMAPNTHRRDALEIAVPTLGGAIIGGFAGSGKAVATGAGIGAGAGTAVVLATRGKDIRLRPGARLRIGLEQPVSLPARAVR